MSVVIFAGGVLGADRRCLVDHGSYDCNIQTMVKIFQGEDKRFAYGYCGDALSESEKMQAAQFFSTKICLFLAGARDADLQLTSDEVKQVGGWARSFIIMTRKRAWHLSYSLKLSEITNLEAYALGNGSVMAYVCLKAGLTVPKTIEMLAIHNTDTGNGMDIIKQTDLLSFTEELKNVKRRTRK